MANFPYNNDNNALLQDRLNRAITILQGLSFPTREEYIAAVYNLVNGIIDNGYGMSKLPLINSLTPAKIGDFEAPITVLNNDSIDIINELNRIENIVSQQYNVAASAENTLRQRIRTNINTSSQKKYYEGFVSNSNIANTSTGTLDINAGHYTNSVTNTTILNPIVTIGSNSSGQLVSGDINNLNSTTATNYLKWAGNKLQLIFSFPTPVPINRIYLKQYDYNDLGITELTNTPDGTYVQDILQDLQTTVLLCDSSSNKNSGETTIDFPPKNCSTLSLTIVNQAGTGFIYLDWIQLIQRAYQSSSILNSNKISAPTGKVIFTTKEVLQSPYSSISHQISFDGTTFQAITPSSIIDISSTNYWYRATLANNVSLISNSGQSVSTGLDPAYSTYYSVANISTIPIGNNLIQKTLVFNTITGGQPISILDPIIINTLTLQQGATILPNSTYTFSGGMLTLDSTLSNVTVTYQANISTSSISSLLSYFSPILVSYSFEVV